MAEGCSECVSILNEKGVGETGKKGKFNHVKQRLRGTIHRNCQSKVHIAETSYMNEKYDRCNGGETMR